MGKIERILSYIAIPIVVASALYGGYVAFIYVGEFDPLLVGFEVLAISGVALTIIGALRQSRIILALGLTLSLAAPVGFGVFAWPFVIPLALYLYGRSAYSAIASAKEKAQAVALDPA